MAVQTLPITMRAAATATTDFLTQTILGTSTTYTTTFILGNTPPATPAPNSQANSGPSNKTVVGAVLGSIAGFVVIMLLLYSCLRNRPGAWNDAVSSDRSDESSSVPHHPEPDVVPASKHYANCSRKGKPSAISEWMVLSTGIFKAPHRTREHEAER